MASQVPHGFAEVAIAGYLSGKTVRCMLLGSVATGPDNPDRKFVSDIVADEASGTNYARQTVTGVTITRDTATDEVYFECDDVTFADLGADVGPVDYVVYFVNITNDAASPIIVVHDLTGLSAGERTPDGSDFIVRPGSQGILKATV